MDIEQYNACRNWLLQYKRIPITNDTFNGVKVGQIFYFMNHGSYVTLKNELEKEFGKNMQKIYYDDVYIDYQYLDDMVTLWE